jgi:hypothetical protein
MFDKRAAVQSRNDENSSILGQLRNWNVQQIFDRVTPDRFQVSKNAGLRSTFNAKKKTCLNFVYLATLEPP